MGLKVTDNKLQWKLVYNESTKHIMIFDKFDGVTKTTHSIYTSESLLDIFDYIFENEIKYDSFKITDYESFYTEAMKELTSPINDDIIDLIESTWLDIDTEYID